MDGRRQGGDAGASPIRELLGGSMRAGDPRRYLVEVMVGAIQADGSVDEAERSALQRILEEHELFAVLPDRARRALLELASDALLFAGGAPARLERIAVALPWRLHRVTAYAMASEIVAADSVVTRDEESYLRTLRRVLVIGSEAEELAPASRRRPAIAVVDSLTPRISGLLDKVVRLCVATRVLAGGLGREDAERIGRVVGGLLDFRGAAPMPRERIERMAIELPPDAGDVCVELSDRILDPAERYWASAYAFAVEAAREPGGPGRWRQGALAPALRVAFEMSEPDMDRAEAHGARMAELSQPR